MFLFYLMLQMYIDANETIKDASLKKQTNELMSNLLY